MDELNELLKDYQQAMQSDELQELARQCQGALDNFDTTMRPYMPQIRQAMLELNKALIPVIEGLQQAQVDAQPLVELQDIVAVEEPLTAWEQLNALSLDDLDKLMAILPSIKPIITGNIEPIDLLIGFIAFLHLYKKAEAKNKDK